MATKPSVAIEEMEMVPERYMDVISGEFAYDPVRLPLDQDPTQLLYNRKTLQIIWETEQHARNPFTRQWFDIKSAIPQTELRKEMKQFVERHRFPAKTVIMEYSKILDEGEMERHLIRLLKYVERSPITENQWTKIWKKMNLVRLFCEFHSENIKLFMSLNGFTYITKVIGQTLQDKDAKEAALDVAKEIVRTIDVILTGLRTRGENSMGILGNDEDQVYVLILCFFIILRHVYYNNNEGYVKIQTLVLRAFSTIFHGIDFCPNGSIIQLLNAYPCALKMLCETNAEDISSEDLNNAIDILGRFQGIVLPLETNEIYARALSNAVIICISRESQRSKETSGFTEGQLLEAEMQARHNSEALEKGMRVIRDIAMEESQLATCILTEGLHIVKELVHMFQRFTDTENEDEDGVGKRKFHVLICGDNCETVHCVHYRVARDGLDISEAISRKLLTFLDVEILRKFISDRTGVHAGPS